MTTSPCVGQCRLDPESGLCLGCARSRDEIAGWGAASAETRQEIWAQLPARREILGQNLHRLDLEGEALRAFVAASLRSGGTWTVGVPGAIAEFSLSSDEMDKIETAGCEISVVSPRGALRFRLDETVRVFGFGSPSKKIFALAVGRKQGQNFSGAGLARLGPDRDALAPQARDDIFYDFGLERSAAAFGLRSRDADLQNLLDGALGQDWRQFLPELGDEMRRRSPTRVARCAIGRIEVFAKIPPPDGVSPEGPHTHLLPKFLAAGDDKQTAGFALPEFFTPCAFYYPPPSTGD